MKDRYPLHFMIILATGWFIVFYVVRVGWCGEAVRLVPEEVRARLAQEGGFDSHEVRIDPDRIGFTSGLQLPPLSRMILARPFDAVDELTRLAGILSTLEDSPASLLINASLLIGQRGLEPVSRDWPISPPTLETFIQELQRLAEQLHQPFEEVTEAQARDFWKLSTPVVQTLAVEFLHACLRALPWIEAGKASLLERFTAEELLSLLDASGTNPAHEEAALQSLSEAKGLQLILNGALELSTFYTLVMEHQDRMRADEFRGLAIIPTAAGPMVFGGVEDHEYQCDQTPLLMLDWGGNDRYSGTYALADATHPISVLIDAGGSDTYYCSAEEWGAGAAMLGAAALIDLGAGNDRMDVRRRAGGYAYLGASLVYNASGDTVYSGVSHNFGAAEKGIAILVDGEGKDEYTSYHAAMGYGYLGGLGLLLDARGNDAYIAPATPLYLASSQLLDQNISAAQGFGTGRFGAALDGLSLPGGIGMLLDKEGDDTYRTGVFGQGVGYAFGIGLLADFAGTDTYTASWYAQGAAAHQACGFLLDASGDDRYTVSHYMSGGAAIDLSWAALVDRTGRDVYTAANAAFGYSLDNAFALLLDPEGDDAFHLHNGEGLGWAENRRQETLRGLWPTFGFFCDLAGLDRYEGKAQANGTAWHGEKADAQGAFDYGVGYDR